jgi:hypothetical protein
MPTRDEKRTLLQFLNRPPGSVTVGSDPECPGGFLVHAAPDAFKSMHRPSHFLMMPIRYVQRTEVRPLVSAVCSRELGEDIMDARGQEPRDRGHRLDLRQALHFANSGTASVGCVYDTLARGLAEHLVCCNLFHANEIIVRYKEQDGIPGLVVLLAPGLSRTSHLPRTFEGFPVVYETREKNE